MNRKGIDVSEFDGEIDWEQVKADGITFAMVRAGFGSSLDNLDPCFERNMNGALAADVSVGAYWFSYAYTPEMAKNEAQVFMEAMKQYRGKVLYPLSFDWEYDSARYARDHGVDPTPDLITDMAIAFLEEIEAGGWYAINYTNLDYYHNQFQMDRLSQFDVWLADYNGPTDIPCGIQQTSDSGKVEGIGDNVDTDTAYKDYPQIMRSTGLNGVEKEEPDEGGGNENDNEQEENEVIYNKVDEVPEWARPTIQKLIDKGYLEGEGDGNLNLNETMLRLLVINDRAGLYN